jgi:hypothetical protein
MASDAEVKAAEVAVRIEHDKICTEMGLTQTPVTPISPTNPRLLNAAIDAAEAARNQHAERLLGEYLSYHPDCTTVNHVPHE